MNFRSIKNHRRKIYHALKSESKTSFMMDTLGIDEKNLKNWINFRMTPEMNRTSIEIELVETISSVDITADEGLRGETLTNSKKTSSSA